MKTKIVNELMKKLAIPIVGGSEDMQSGYRFGILVAINVIEKEIKETNHINTTLHSLFQEMCKYESTMKNGKARNIWRDKMLFYIKELAVLCGLKATEVLNIKST